MDIRDAARRARGPHLRRVGAVLLRRARELRAERPQHAAAARREVGALCGLPLDLRPVL